jgi:hypothetical protein
MDRNEAIEIMKELIEHQLVQAQNVSMRWEKENAYILILRGSNSLFLSAYTSDKSLLIHEDKDKGLLRIVSH